MTKWFSIISTVLLLALCEHAIASDTSTTDSSPKLRLYTATSTKIWDDKGSGAKYDVSIWRPQHVPSGYFPVGDIAIDGHHANSYTNARVVRDLQSGGLAVPRYLVQLWTDKGSGADSDVAIYKMVPPAGYTCLGNIATNSYDSLPDKSKYRCVKDDYLVDGTLALIWYDIESGADNDVSFRRVDGTSSGYGPHTFLSYPFYNPPSGNPGKAFDKTKAHWKTV